MRDLDDDPGFINMSVGGVPIILLLCGVLEIYLEGVESTDHQSVQILQGL